MLRLLLTCVCALASGPPPAPRPLHPGPPVYVEATIGELDVTFRFTGEQVTLNRWLGKPDPDAYYEAPMAAADIDRVRDAVGRLVAANDPIAIDGVRSVPRIADVQVPPDDVTGYGLPALQFSLVYAIDTPPRTIDFVWAVWERMEWFGSVKLPLVFRSFGESQMAFVAPDEPGYSWRPESVVPRQRPRVVEVDSPPPPTIPLPLVSFAVVVALCGAFPFLVRAKVGPAVLAALTVSGGLTAWIARDAVVVEVRNPLRPSCEVPDEAAATALFDQLLRNVYAAFDARTEDEIYELLAVSVAPELLDEMYGEIYESLILRGEGGAVCQVLRVEVLEREVDVTAEYEPWDIVPDERRAAPFFRAQWKWNAIGVVSHWGHEHRRTNSYEASYIVRNDGGGWRLAACEILDHSRIDGDG